MKKEKLSREVQEKLTFNEENNMHLKLDINGKTLEPDSYMSTKVDFEMLEWTATQESNPFLHQFTFILEDYTAQEIKKATLLIDAPLDSEGNEAGEDLEIEIDFSKD